MTTVREYVAALDEPARSALDRVLDVALDVAPDAGDGTSYGIPVLMVDGRAVLGLRAGKKHLSLYPFSGSVIAAMGDRLSDFSTSAGTIRFTAQRPLTDDLVREVVTRRVAEVRGAADG